MTPAAPAYYVAYRVRDLSGRWIPQTPETVHAELPHDVVRVLAALHRVATAAIRVDRAEPE